MCKMVIWFRNAENIERIRERLKQLGVNTEKKQPVSNDKIETQIEQILEQEINHTDTKKREK